MRFMIPIRALGALCLSLAVVANLAIAQDKPAKAPAKPRTPAKKTLPTWPDEAGLYNVALTSLGATANASGSPVNKDWPGALSIQEEEARPRGTLFGNPMLKGRIDIRLAMPVPIKAIETVGLDYNGTRQPKAIDILVDDKLVKHVDLPEQPGETIRTPIDATGQVVSVVITDQYDVRKKKDGTDGPNYGGWQRIRVLTPTDLTAHMKQPDGYVVATPAPENIAPTIGAAVEGGEIKVFGEPRMADGHPRTLWDKQDITQFRELLKTSAPLQQQYADLKKGLDARLKQPIKLPEPRKDAKGEWAHLSDKDGDTGKIHNQLGLDIANLGTVYALSGEEKYAEFAKQILLKYAEKWPKYGVGARAGFSHDPSKIFDQRLSDSIWFIQVVRGWDIIQESTCINSDERERIVEGFIKPEARFIAANGSVLRGATNWSAICCTAILMAGYATDDQELIDTAMYGAKGTKEKPTGGVILHFSEKCIGPDGLWSEGSTGYQFMAMESLVTNAEILWRNGIDMYRYRDGALKKLFDSPIRYAYPNLYTPAIHDGGGSSIVGYEGDLYEYGYLRYQDPSYLTILNKMPLRLGAQYQKWPISVLWDRDTSAAAPPVEHKPVNFFDVGFGILRLTDEKGTASLLMDYGPNRSHGHPDKLNLDLYALNQKLMPDPGSVWYEQPIYRAWYRTSIAHNTLVVDEQDQKDCDGQQLVYGVGETISMQRGWTDQAYAGVAMDRSVFFTPNYVADLFGVFNRMPHKLDLAYHFIGELETSLPLQPIAQPLTANGYATLKNVKTAITADGWTAAVKAANGTARFVAAAGPSTEVIIGDGVLGRQTPPTIIQRRDNTASTVFGNAIDISNAQQPYVKKVTTTGGLAEGYSLLSVETASGTDLCFTGWKPGMHEIKELEFETDAQQAFVLRDGNTVRAMYLGGGTRLSIGEFSLTRWGGPGLALLERTSNGGWIVANPSGKTARIGVQHIAGLEGTEAYSLDAQGRRTGKVSYSRQNNQIDLEIGPASRVEFAKPGVPSGFDAKQAMLKKQEEEKIAAAAKAKAEALERSKAREAKATASPAPANTTIAVQAEDFTKQGGGEATAVENKVGAIGKALSGWNSSGHWIEWTIDAPAAGSYNLSLLYCTIHQSGEREVMVNGTVIEPTAPLNVPGTGGWSNGADEWQLGTVIDPANEKPLLIELQAGANTVRLTNTDGNGLNVDYLLFTSPDVKAARIAK